MSMYTLLMLATSTVVRPELVLEVQGPILELRASDPLPREPQLQLRLATEASQLETRSGQAVSDQRSWWYLSPDQAYWVQTRWTDEPWSEPRQVHAAPAPTAAPLAPTALLGHADSAVTALLRWKDRSDNEYGFVVEACDRNSSRCVDADYVLPNQTQFRVHMLQPDTQYRFAVRAGNPAGRSQPSPQLGIRTPALTATRSAHATRCTSQAEVLAGAGESGNSDSRVTLSDKRVALPNQQHGDVFLIEADYCHRAGCPYQLYGEVDGCYRLLGEFDEIYGQDAQGWPLLIISDSLNAGSGSAELTHATATGPQPLDSWEYGDWDKAGVPAPNFRNLSPNDLGIVAIGFDLVCVDGQDKCHQ